MTNPNEKITKIFYFFVLPTITTLFLLGISSFTQRDKLFKSDFFDLLVRVLLALWFCGLYIRLSKISEFSVYPNKKWSKSDVSFIERIVYSGLSIFLSIGSGVVTWWMVSTFFPDFRDWGIAVAGLNTVIILCPLLTHYWVLKL
jgi:hypothetical protein